MDGSIQLGTYVAVKYIAYTAWCTLGVWWLKPADKSALRAGLGFGFIRLFIGIAAGIGIFLVGGMAHLQAWPNILLQYFVVYAPVRWFEWGIMELLMAKRDRSTAVVFVVGGDGRSRLWRFGGILVSHLADIPMITMGSGVHEMLPVGRFLC
jgi:hypothetical protein